jgi:hypothetical protein
MSPTPEEAATEPQVAPADAPSAPAQADDVPSTAAPSAPPVPPKPEEKDARSSHTLLYTVFGFLCMGVALWLVFAWTGYKDRYSQQTEGWHLGSTKMIEVTLIRDDKKNLACSSDKSFADVHCGYYANTQPWGPGPERMRTPFSPSTRSRTSCFLPPASGKPPS